MSATKKYLCPEQVAVRRKLANRLTAKQRERVADALGMVLNNLKDTIKCIRRGDLGDYSPMMDEVFDSEHAIKQAEKALK